MLPYFSKRVLHAVFVLLGVSLVVFLGLKAIPGDAIDAMLGREYTPEAAADLRRKYGFDQPVPIQYVRWLGLALRGDLGTSFISGEPVMTGILEAVPRTISIAIVAWVFGMIVALSTGLLSALRPNTASDFVPTVIAFLGLSMPSFWVAIVLILVVGVQLRWLPTVGYTNLSEGFWPWLRHLILPGISVGLAYGAIVSRQVRGSLIETLKQNYIRTARAKGLTNNVIVVKHALQNAMIPVVTVAGIQLALILGGAVVVETIFSIRGLGRLLVDAIANRDYFMVQGAVVVVAVIFVGSNIVIDFLYTLINPRIRFVGGE
jgi:peptide/nickel transport system permease protein